MTKREWNPVMKSKYHNVCKDCRDDIEPGDHIIRSEDDKGWVHFDCSAVVSLEPAKVCSKCYMTTCDCGEEDQ